MPSPFPGVDPYLEAPHIWPDLHDALAAEMRSELNLEALVEDLPEPMAYLVLVNKAWRRVPGVTAYQVFPIGLREWLPCIPVPLKETEAEVTLDLQFAFNRAYDTGPYRRGAVNYAGDPAEPPLGEKDAAWAAELTRPWRESAPADPHSFA
jgi:hypothetical protein